MLVARDPADPVRRQAELLSQTFIGTAVPAKAGTHFAASEEVDRRTPAFAGDAAFDKERPGAYSAAALSSTSCGVIETIWA
jgi:hypothetical protein